LTLASARAKLTAVTVTASAPAKLMLYGEHAVVYGVPCVVTAVDLRVRVSVALRRDDRVTIRTPMLAESFTIRTDEVMCGAPVPPAVHFVVAALRACWQTTAPCGLDLHTRADFSHSYGLGSSSAVTVATVKALNAATGASLDAQQVFRLSYDAVLDAQRGIGSGYDVAAAAFGGTLYYITPGDVIEPLTREELPLVIGYSGIKASTTEWVRRVAELRERHPALVQHIWRLTQDLVDEARGALMRRDWAACGRLMDINHGLLSALGVSTGPLDSLVHAARAAGAYGAKLSGAGGGDCMIALADEDRRSSVTAALNGSGLPAAGVVTVRTGAEGVRIEA